MYNARDETRVLNFGRKNLKGEDHLEDLGVDGRIILQLNLKKKRRRRVCIGFIRVRAGSSDGFM
jgi:hypothetical protein